MEAQRLFRRNVPVTIVVWVLPCNSHCISPGYTVTISLILVLPLGAVLPEVAWSPALKANDGIGICPLGLGCCCYGCCVIVVAVVVVIVIAVVVVCSCRPAPTVLGQVAKLLAVSACWYTRTVMVEVTLGTSRFSPFIRFLVTVPSCMAILKVLILYPSIQSPFNSICMVLAAMPQH
ncbi:hypothetical protein Tco_0563201 [Tanacetum coccineum]